MDNRRRLSVPVARLDIGGPTAACCSFALARRPVSAAHQWPGGTFRSRWASPDLDALRDAARPAASHWPSLLSAANRGQTRRHLDLVVFSPRPRQPCRSWIGQRPQPSTAWPPAPRTTLRQGTDTLAPRRLTTPILWTTPNPVDNRGWRTDLVGPPDYAGFRGAGGAPRPQPGLCRVRVPFVQPTHPDLSVSAATLDSGGRRLPRP